MSHCRALLAKRWAYLVPQILRQLRRVPIFAQRNATCAELVEWALRNIRPMDYLVVLAVWAMIASYALILLKVLPKS